MLSSARNVDKRQKGTQSENSGRHRRRRNAQARGQGEPIEGGVAGDLYVKIHIEPHKFWHKEGVNIVGDLKVKLSDALLAPNIRSRLSTGQSLSKFPKVSLTAKFSAFEAMACLKVVIAVMRSCVSISSCLANFPVMQRKIEELKKEGI